MGAEDLQGLLRQGAAQMGLSVPEPAVSSLLRHLELLVKWNRTINLTAVTDPAEMVEKHLLDSLAVAAMVPAGTLLDAGSGAGFPGIPLRLVRPDVTVTLVDSVGKKVAFLKNLIADLRLDGVRAASSRLAGQPAKEGLPLFDAAIARAFAAPEEWLALAQRYVRPGGAILVLSGPKDAFPSGIGRAVLQRETEYRLPFSGSHRRAGLYRVEQESL